MHRLVVLISGNGSNLQAIIDAIVEQRLKGTEIVHVFSNRSNAYGLERARQASINTTTFPLKLYRDQQKTREEYDADLAKLIVGQKPDLVVLAGWMHILSSAFLERVQVPVINLHPALPGAFDGARAIERAFEAFQQGQIEHTGVMVHHVIAQVDRGEVIDKEQVPIHPSDTLEQLQERIHQTEHGLLVRAIAKVLKSQQQ